MSSALIGHPLRTPSMHGRPGFLACVLAGLALAGCDADKAKPQPAAAPTGAAAAGTGAVATAGAAATTGTAAAADKPTTAAGACVSVFDGDVDAIRLVSKAAATGSDIDLRFEFGTGRVSGSAYKMVDTILEATSPDYQAQPEQVDALKAALKGLCLNSATSNGEAPKGFVRYGLVARDGSERWLVAQGLDAGLPVDGVYFPTPREAVTAISGAWPRDPTR